MRPVWQQRILAFGAALMFSACAGKTTGATA